MQKTKRFIFTIIYCIINSFTAALSLKANIGVGAFDATFNTLAQIFNIKVGYMLILLCLLCLFITIILLGKETKLNVACQMVLPLIGGYVVNFFYYDILKFEITSYPIRLLSFVISNIISAFAVSGLMYCNIFFYPLEGTCNVLAAKTKKNFTFWRQLSDIILISTSLICCFIFSIPLTVREGTIISALIYGPLINFFMKFQKKIIK